MGDDRSHGGGMIPGVLEYIKPGGGGSPVFHTGKIIIAGDGGTPLHIFDIAAGALADGVLPASPPTSAAFGVVFNPDKSIITVSNVATPFITQYNTGDLTKLANLSPLPPQAVFQSSWSPDGANLLIAVGANKIQRYETLGFTKLADPNIAGSISGTGYVCVTHSPDGQFIAAGGLGSSTRYLTILDATTHVALANTPLSTVDPSSGVNSVHFSSDSSLLAVGSTSGLYVYDTSDWSLVSQASVPGSVQDVKFSNSGNHLAVSMSFSSPTLRIYQTSDWSQVTNMNPGTTVQGLSWDDNDDLLCVTWGGGGGDHFQVYETNTWLPLTSPATPPTINCYGSVFY